MTGPDLDRVTRAHLCSGSAPCCMLIQITTGRRTPIRITSSVGQVLGLHLFRPSTSLHVRSISSLKTGPDLERVIIRPGPRFRMIQRINGTNSARSDWIGPALHCYCIEHQLDDGPRLRNIISRPDPLFRALPSLPLQPTCHLIQLCRQCKCTCTTSISDAYHRM
jgi:hypothetical protein